MTRKTAPPPWLHPERYVTVLDLAGPGPVDSKPNGYPCYGASLPTGKFDPPSDVKAPRFIFKSGPRAKPETGS